MRRLQRSQLFLVFTGVLGGLGMACAPPKPFTTTLVLPSLKVHDDSEVTKDNITISVTPIFDDNAQDHPDIFKRVAYTGTRKDALGKVETYRAEAATTIIPSPNFKVRIANHTGHVIKFTQTVFRLQDDKGKTYQLYGGTSDITAWMEGVWSSNFGPQVAVAVMPQLTAAISSLSLLNRNVELLNGDEWSGYLVFNIGINTQADFDRFMSSINRLTLRMAECRWNSPRLGS